MAMNAHRVFENNTSYGSYHSAIAVTAPQEDALREARDKIRRAIREGLRGWDGLVRQSELFEDALNGFAPPALRPKFRMQGSFSYRTQVEPAHLPPQEIDLDDGLFLPVSFLLRGTVSRPVVLSRGLFAAVEHALAPLCEEEGWTLVTDKPSCVRVKISDMAHVDIALYAIPDAQFAQLVEATAMRVAKGDGQFRDRMRDSIEFDDDLYRDLRNDALMLAHRVEGWKPSDPRKLDDWFQDAISTHGQQVRRVSKYLKGWRDFQWERPCRLSSIALMAAVVSSYDGSPNDFDEARDDLALLAVARELPAFLSNRIENPVVPGQYLDEGWTVDQRNEFVTRSSELANAIHRVVNRTASPDEALQILSGAFGGRIPEAPDLVGLDGAQESLAAPATHDAEAREHAAAAAINEVKHSGDGTKPWGSHD